MFWQHFFTIFVTGEIIISQENAHGFHSLSKEFENSVLFSICKNVILSGNSQSFFLFRLI
jgi:hypothetical protein